tara:strand:- start:39179 stop:41290 length:2112 start_codon:yes stop_codon:yes gene_type:complete
MSLVARQQNLEIHWFDAVNTLAGVGQAISDKLHKMDMYCIGDLLLHFPYQYQDRTRLTPLRYLNFDQEALIQGTIIGQKEVRIRRKQLTVTLEDNTGIIDLTFFHYYPNLSKMLTKGKSVRAYGKVKLFKGQASIVHPDFEILKNSHEPLESHFTPMYRSVPGISQKWWRKTIAYLVRHLDYLSGFESSALDHILQADYPFDIKEAMSQIHMPSPEQSIEDLITREHKLLQRFIFEELLAHRLSLDSAREQNAYQQAYSLSVSNVDCQSTIEKLPFELTADQALVFKDIRLDLTQNKPMTRLLQGDVGSGKTIIAILAAWVAVKNNYQVAIMAPTEVLAEQLYQQVTLFFEPFAVTACLLTGRLKAKEKRNVYQQISSHRAHVIVGTHALFQKEVNFAKLGLVVIDEQHRFGVHQRLSLHAKGQALDDVQYGPHQLIMTATPIPRTLCMSYYAHLDTSQIYTMPKGRKPIQTIALSCQKREEMMGKISAHCQNGQQVYWVCTLVEESEHFEAEPAVLALERLQAALPHLRIGLVHGKLKSDEKAEVMRQFRRGTIQVLIATTVIEVGVNVPNATLMVIENAERLGLSQLHQLRGRVGRGAQQSYCVLLYQQPLSLFAKKRIQTLRETTDGFEIAEQDLKLRGPGEVLGTRQSGISQLKIANIIRDHALLPKVNTLLARHDLPQQEIERLKARWFKNKTDYIKV